MSFWFKKKKKKIIICCYIVFGMMFVFDIIVNVIYYVGNEYVFDVYVK